MDESHQNLLGIVLRLYQHGDGPEKTTAGPRLQTRPHTPTHTPKSHPIDPPLQTRIAGLESFSSSKINSCKIIMDRGVVDFSEICVNTCDSDCCLGEPLVPHQNNTNSALNSHPFSSSLADKRSRLPAEVDWLALLAPSSPCATSRP